ncbi:MAG: hypothetical protein KBD12_01560 [Candidatus Pacebacteria bacterium]|nr:hypothetical protein [Candidatus Paceibacterota bacterium]
MNAMVLVPARQNSEIIFRITQRTLFELEPGIYFFPFLWWWGEENNPYATNDSSSSFLRIDSAKTFRHRSVGFWEDVGRDFIIPFIFRRNSWSVIICLAMAFFIGKWSVDIKDYLKGDKDIQIEQKINYHPLYDNNTIFKLN